MKKNRYLEAYDALRRLRNTQLQAARDLFYINAQLEIENEAMGKNTNYTHRVKTLFTERRVRSATLASFIVMIAQQMCGSRLDTYLLVFNGCHAELV